MDERELTALLRRGDQRGMELLLWHYGPLMKYVITPILPDPRDREDCPSEAALRVWEHIGQFDGQRGSWRAWLTAVTRNAALNHARHGGGEELDERLPAPEPGPEETLLRRERQAATRDVLARLHATDRALLYRKYYYQQSTAQIAAELATTERVVEGRIYRLKKHLRILLAGGCVCGLLFGTSYPMAWTAVDAGAQSGTAEIRAQLEKLGVPDYVLDDLAPEDLTACDGALRVVVETQNEPLNKDKQKALHITGVAVELPGERERWMIIQHFRWKGNPGFYGTESIRLWPAYQDSDGWRAGGAATGRVLYDKDGQSYAVPYYFLGKQTYTADSVFWEEQTGTDLFAAFSMPLDGENCRGYVAYPIEELQDGYLISSWFNYTHQRTTLQYPARSAMETRMINGWNDAGAFITMQYAIQFRPEELPEP